MKRISIQEKNILMQMNLKEFNVTVDDIVFSEEIEPDLFISAIVDEENTSAVIIFDFNDMTYTIETSDYKETTEMIILGCF